MLGKNTIVNVFVLSLLLLSTLLILPALAEGGEQSTMHSSTQTEEADQDVKNTSAPVSLPEQNALLADHVSKTGPTIAETDGPVTYTVVMFNENEITTTMVLSDMLVDNVAYVADSLTCEGGTGTCYYSNTSELVGWQGWVAPAETVTVTFTVDVTEASCQDTLVNTATVATYFHPFGTGQFPTGTLQLGDLTTVNHATTLWDNVTFHNDFEMNDGHLITNTNGEWEWGDLDSSSGSPSAAHSGSKLWATNLDDDITTEPSDHYLTKTVTLPIFAEGYLSWWDWWDQDGLDVGLVTINGIPVYGINVDQMNNQNFYQRRWTEHIVNLAHWQNQSVEIVFYYLAGGSSSGGAGWYVDDMSILSCTPPETPYLDNSWKTAPTDIFNSNAFTYTITVQNASTAVASETMVIDPLPAGTTYVAGSAINSATYNTSLNQIEWTGTLSPGEKIDIAFMVDVDTTALTIANTAVVSHVSLTQSVMLPAVTNIIHPADYPTCFDFENGLRPANMFFEATQEINSKGRVQVSDSHPHGGDYALNIDTDSNGLLLLPYDTRQGAIFVYNPISTSTDVELSFWLQGHGDGQDDADGIFLSDDNGLTYSKVYTFPSSSFGYRFIALNLSQLAAEADINLNQTLYIKFQTQDNTFIPADGYTIDDLCLQEARPYLHQSAKLVSGGVLAGDTFTYTVYISNTGTSTATNVNLTDPIPNGATYVPDSVTPDGSYNATLDQIEWNGDVPPGELAKFTFAVVAQASVGARIVNVGTITQVNLVEPVVFSKSTKIVYPLEFPSCIGFEEGVIPDFMYTENTLIGETSRSRVEVSPDNPYEGAYALQLDTENGGSKTRQGAGFVVDLTDISQAELNFWLMDFDDEPDGEDGIFISDNGGDWFSFKKIHPLSASVITYTYENIVIDLIAAAAEVGVPTNGNLFIRFQAKDDNAIPNDGFAFDNICVQKTTKTLGVTKMDYPDPVMVGDTITYTIGVNTKALTDITQVELSDTLPDTLDFVSVTSTIGTCTDGPQVVCQFDTLTETSRATVTLVVQANSAGLITNTATVTADTAFETSGDKMATAYTAVFSDIVPLLYGTVHDGPESPATLYQIHPLRGETTIIGSMGFNQVDGLDVNPTNGLLYATGHRADESNASVLLLVDPDSGESFELGPTNIESLDETSISDLSFDGTGQLFAYTQPNNQLGTIDLSTGLFTPLGTVVSRGNKGNSLAVSSQGELYHADNANVNQLNPLNGTVIQGYPLHFFVPISQTRSVNSLDFMPQVDIMFSVLHNSPDSLNQNYLAVVEGKTGLVNVVTPTIPGLQAIAFGPAISPDNIADLSITKADNPTMMMVGDLVTYTIVVASKGFTDSAKVIVTDTLPAGAMLVTASTTLGSCDTTSPIVCNLGDLADDAEATITIVVSATQSGMMNNMVSATSDSFDPTPTNTAIASTAVFSGDLPPLYGVALTGDGAASLYTLNPMTGEASVVGAIGFDNVMGLDVHPDTRYLYGTGERADDDTQVLIAINPNTGVGIEVGLTGIEALGEDSITDISFHNGDGILYAYTAPGDRVGMINVESGAFTSLGTTLPAGCCGNGIAFSAEDTLYHADNVALSTLNQANGSRTTVKLLNYPIPASTTPALDGLEYMPNSDILFGSLDDGVNYLVLVETVTGKINIIGESATGLEAIAYGPAVASLSGTPTIYLPLVLKQFGN